MAAQRQDVMCLPLRMAFNGGGEVQLGCGECAWGWTRAWNGKSVFKSIYFELFNRYVKIGMFVL